MPLKSPPSGAFAERGYHRATHITHRSHSQPAQLTANCVWVEKMRLKLTDNGNKRRGSRTKAVLPVKMKGIDVSGDTFEELVHTLDVTATGVRLGSVRRELNLMDEVTVLFRQRKMTFRVVWVKKLKGTSEFQVGLQAVAQDREAWGINFAEQEAVARRREDAMQASGSA